MIRNWLPIDRPTDIPSYREAWTHLKRAETRKRKVSIWYEISSLASLQWWQRKNTIIQTWQTDHRVVEELRSSRAKVDGENCWRAPNAWNQKRSKSLFRFMHQHCKQNPNLCVSSWLSIQQSCISWFWGTSAQVWYQNCQMDIILGLHIHWVTDQDVSNLPNPQTRALRVGVLRHYVGYGSGWGQTRHPTSGFGYN